MKYRHFAKAVILALIGGSIYVFIELVWRGYSHISMFILGGVCFVIIGLINELFPWDLGLLWQSIIGAFVVRFFFTKEPVPYVVIKDDRNDR